MRTPVLTVLLSICLGTACFDPRLSADPHKKPTKQEPDVSPSDDAGPANKPMKPDGSVHSDASNDGGAEAATSIRHSQCSVALPDDLPPLTGARPWFAFTPVTSCDEMPMPTPCGPRNSCPFEGRCVHVDGAELGVCVKGKGKLPLVYREGTCVTWVDEPTRGSLCCAGLGGLDCETTPRATQGAPGALCGRHADCEAGLVCKTSKSIGRCLCPETELADVSDSSTCEGSAGPRPWGVTPNYDPAHRCVAAPDPDLSVDVLFDRYVEDESTAADALVDAEAVGDAMHIAYATKDGVVMHLVAEKGEVTAVATKRVLRQLGNVAVPAAFLDIDLAVDRRAPEEPIVHIAIASDMGVLYLSGDALVQAAPFASDVAIGFDDTIESARDWPRTPVLALARGQDFQLLAFTNDRFEAAKVMATGDGREPLSSEIALLSETGGVFRVLQSIQNQDALDTWWNRSFQTGFIHRRLPPCRAPVGAGTWFACDDAMGSVVLIEWESLGEVSKFAAVSLGPWQIESTWPALAESASHLAHLAYRSSRGLETRVVGSDAAPRWMTNDRTTSRPVVIPSDGTGPAGVLYATTTTSVHHQQLRFAHAGPCLRADGPIALAPEPAPISPVKHPACASPLAREPLTPIVDRDASGRPLVSGMSDTSCDDLPTPHSCSESEPCFAGEACLETATPGLSVCIEASLSDERCSAPTRDDRTRQGVLGLTAGGQCLRCFTPESRRLACCLGVVGIDCRDIPSAQLGSVGDVCTAHAQCEAGLVCADTVPGQACACPDEHEAPIRAMSPADERMVCEPDKEAWLNDGLPVLAVGECAPSLAPGWSIENVAGQRNFWFDSLEGRIVADDTGGFAVVAPYFEGLSLARFANGVWTRRLLSDYSPIDASIAIDKVGTLYVITRLASGTEIMSNESGAFANWNVTLDKPLTFGAMFADAMGTLHLVGNQFDRSYHRITRSGSVPPTIATKDELAKLALSPSGEYYLYSAIQGGPIRSDSWLAESMPTLVDVAVGPDGMVRVEESPPHGVRVISANGTVQELFQNTDPRFAAGPTTPSLAVARDGTRWISYRAPTGLMVSTDSAGSWEQASLVQAQVVHEMILDAHDEPHVFFATAEQGQNLTPLYRAFRGPCPERSASRVSE